MPIPLRHLALALLPVLSTACSEEPPREGSQSTAIHGAAKPNVVVLLVDTLRRDRVGAFGGDTGLTPFLDSLAARSITFPHTYSTSSWTKPAVASVLTGLYPGQHAAVRVGNGGNQSYGRGILASEHLTLAEVLQDAGYRTAGFVANPHIRVETRFDQGFDLFVYEKAHGEMILDQALTWIEGGADHEPFFLYAHIVDPHSPYAAPSPFREAYQPDPIDRAPFTNLGQSVEVRGWLMARVLWEKAGAEEPFVFDYDAFFEGAIRDLPQRVKSFPDAETLRERSFLDFTGLEDPRLLERVEALTLRYDGEVAYTDHVIEQFFSGLSERGALENTVILFVADHGECLLERGDWGHHIGLSAQEVNVPMLLHVPHLEPVASRFEGNASLVDVYPTLLEVLDLPIPENLSGVSLWSRARAGSAPVPDRAVFSELIGKGIDRVAVHFAGRKLVRAVDPKKRVTWELYDLDDLEELAPLPLPEDDPRIEDLRRRIDAFLAQRRLHQLTPEEEGSLSEEDRAELMRLGYL